MHRRLFSLILCFFWTLIVLAQEPRALYQWGEMLDLSRYIDLTQSDEEVFYASRQGIIAIDKVSLKHRSITKLNGLSDSEITRVKFNQDLGQLIISYLNGNIDILENEKVYNVPEIKENQFILKSKAANDLIITDNKLWIAADYGIVEFDLERLDFGTTLFTEESVSTLTVEQDDLYMVTSDAIWQIERSKNFADFTKWGRIVTLPDASRVKSLQMISSELHLLVDERLVRLNEGNLLPVELIQNQNFSHFQSFDNTIYALENCYKCGLSLKKLLPNAVVSSNTECLTIPLKFIIDNSTGIQRFWYMDDQPGIKYAVEGQTCTNLSVERPVYGFGHEIKVTDDELIIGRGGIVGVFGNAYSIAGAYLQVDTMQFDLSERHFNFFSENDVRDIITVGKHPSEDLYYFGSFWSGLIEFDLQDFKLYNETNSGLTPSVFDGRIRVADFEFDNNENLWVVAFNSEIPLAVKTPEGDWFNFEIPYGSDPRQIHIDHQNNIYITLLGQGLAVFNPGNSIESTGDDKWTLINVTEEGLPSRTIYDLSEDLDGNIWVGTNAGGAYINCDQELNCSAFRPIVGSKYLLFNEQVRAITVDGANRKWFGTLNGIYLQSQDNEEELLHFTTENSPLINDRIFDLAINPKSGVLYISTESGIMTYKSDATKGENFHIESEIYAYPNPAYPSFTGNIAIKGLSQNAYVKIMSPTGYLIQEGRALGGQYIWDQKDQDGNDVSAGMYTVHSYNTDYFGPKKDGHTILVAIIR